MAKEICPHCGSPAQPGELRCAVCGASLAESPVTTTALATSASPATASPTTPPSATPSPGQPAAASPAPSPSGAAGGLYPPPATPSGAPYPAPYGYGFPATGYPAASYPAAGYAPMYSYGYPAYGYPGVAYSAYGYGAYGYPAPYWPGRPKRAPGEVYALTIAWIATILSGIGVAAGLIGALLTLLGLFTGSGDDLSFLGISIGYSLGPIVAGGFGLWYGILGIMRRRAPRFQLPSAWLMLGLAALAVGGALALWNINETLSRAPGVAIGVFPLAFLTGALPALTIVAFASQRMGNPSTRRHVWLSMFYGMTLAALLAQILEAILTLIIIAALGLNASAISSVLTPSGQASPQIVLAAFLVLSVVAPLVEEGVKPLAALVAIRRLRTPAEAFLVGLAAGAGFDIFETITYIGSGQADWVAVSIERIGAGLLHGVGAGMGALFWYYLINGKGVRLRWLRATGAILYAVLQHGIFNGLTLVLSPAGKVLPSSWIDWLGQPLKVGALPLQNSDMVFLVIYALILTVLVIMTARLRGAQGMPERPADPAPQWLAGSPYAPYPYLPWGYAPAPQATPAVTPAATPAMTGGAQ